MTLFRSNLFRVAIVIFAFSVVGTRLFGHMDAAEEAANMVAARLDDLMKLHNPSFIRYTVVAETKPEAVSRIWLPQQKLFYELAKKGDKIWAWVSADSFRSNEQSKGNVVVVNGGQVVRGTIGGTSYITGMATPEDVSVGTSFFMYSGFDNAREALHGRATGRFAADITLYDGPKSETEPGRLVCKLKNVPRSYSCWFLPGSHNLIRYEQYAGQELQTRTSILDYRVIDGITYPHHSRLEWFRNGTVVRTENCEVQEAVFSARSVPDSLFTISFPKDAIIHDADRKQIIRNTDGVENELKAISHMIAKPPRIWLWLSLGFLAAVIAMTFVVYWRKRRQTNA